MEIVIENKDQVNVLRPLWWERDWGEGDGKIFHYRDQGSHSIRTGERASKSFQRKTMTPKKHALAAP